MAIDEMMGQEIQSIDFLQNQPAEPEVQTIVLDRDAMLKELHSWCMDFIKKSKEWRRGSFEDKWEKWQRHSDGIYDPELSKKKEDWQSRAFWPVTASHRETAQAQLYRTELGPKPALDVKPRPGLGGDVDQAADIKDSILREREKSRYELERNKILEDKTTFGSGFAQIFFETKVEDRMVTEPVFAEIDPNDPASIEASLSGQTPVIGYKRVVKPQVIYRGVRFRHIPIFDIFPDPKALEIKGHAIAHRYYITYGELVDGAKPGPDGQPGYVLPEAIEALKQIASNEVTPEDKKLIEINRNITEAQVTRTDYQRKLECYEIQARLPKKWVLINGEEIDDPEELIPAVVRVHDLTVVSVELNPQYDGEPNIYKDDYMPVAGQFYGRGIPEMLSDVQEVSNESINQRLDSAIVALLNVYAVIEKSVVDPKDFTLGPGSTIRLRAQDGITGVDQLLRRIDMGNISREAFIEPQEWERIAQERTSITRTTLGTEANQDITLGAQQIQQGVTGAKLAYLGMLSESGFLYDITHAYYKLIYTNYNPEDFALAIGPERASRFIPMSPEQLENSYSYIFQGVFSAENKAQRQARLAAIDQQFGMEPYFNRLEVLKAELQTADEDPDKFIIQEAEATMIMQKAQQMAAGMVAQQQAQQAPASKKPAPAPPGGMNV